MTHTEEQDDESWKEGRHATGMRVKGDNSMPVIPTVLPNCQENFITHQKSGEVAGQQTAIFQAADFTRTSKNVFTT